MRLLRDQLISPLSRVLELALFDKLVPDRFGVLLRRGNGDNVELLAAGGRAVVEARLDVQACHLEFFLERLEGGLELVLARWVRGVELRHDWLLGLAG